MLATTTQMATLHISTFTQWVERMRRKTGVPPVVFVDEAHMSSNENRWGETMGQLGDAGAFIVLATATAFRADGRAIPGFNLKQVRTTPVTLRRPNAESRTVDIFEGDRTYYELVAHHTTTFQEAWAEIPSPLCKIDREPFEIEGEEVDGATGELTSGVKLSRLGVDATRRALMPALKSRRVIQKASRILVLQRRFLNLVSFWPEIASRKARLQSCQARWQVAMKRCSRSLSGEPSL